MDSGRGFGVVAALAALAFAPGVPAQPQAEDPQDLRRDKWALAADRSPWAGEPALRFFSPAGEDAGWLRSSDVRPTVQLDLAQGWALWADWDRYRPKAMQARESIDTFLLGLRYKFP